MQRYVDSNFTLLGVIIVSNYSVSLYFNDFASRRLHNALKILRNMKLHCCVVIFQCWDNVSNYDTGQYVFHCCSLLSFVDFLNQLTF